MRVDQRYYRFLLSQEMLTIIKDTANLNFVEGPSIKTYAPRGRGGEGGGGIKSPIHFYCVLHAKKKKKRGGGGGRRFR